jgi:hypothetical protein
MPSAASGPRDGAPFLFFVHESAAEIWHQNTLGGKETNPRAGQWLYQTVGVDDEAMIALE